MSRPLLINGYDAHTKMDYMLDKWPPHVHHVIVINIIVAFHRLRVAFRYLSVLNLMIELKVIERKKTEESSIDSK